MAEESKALDYIPEVVLKKRKNNEEWAIKRREQLEARHKSRKEDRKLIFKRPEDFVKRHRDKQLDLVLMKQRRKLRHAPISEPGADLLFVIRISGMDDMHPKIRKTLDKLRLKRICSGVFVKASERLMDMLIMVEPYVTYGIPNLKSVRELVFKKGYGKVDRQRIPLIDNNIIEEALGKYGIICLEDIVHEIAKVGPHFKEVTHFLWPFKLTKPDRAQRKKKLLFKNGGDAGDRGNKINELISQMN